MKNYLFLCLIFTSVIEIKSQGQKPLNFDDVNLNWFLSINYGFQMSGIKSEDFVSSNYSPLFNVTVGKWVSPLLALQIGYKGFYFNYIEDDVKHHYNYFYGEALFNLNNAIYPNRINKNWSLLIHSGAGYFYNHVYGRANLCANIGIQNNYQLTDYFIATLDISSIIGWDIYQGDEDILPGITVGIAYLIKN